MNKEEWIEKCALRFEQRAGLTKEEARNAAEACADSECLNLSDDPEEAADEEMSYWTDDGE